MNIKNFNYNCYVLVTRKSYFLPQTIVVHVIKHSDTYLCIIKYNVNILIKNYRNPNIVI